MIFVCFRDCGVIRFKLVGIRVIRAMRLTIVIRVTRVIRVFRIVRFCEGYHSSCLGYEGIRVTR